MKKFALVVFLLIIGFSFIPLKIQGNRIPNLKKPEFFTRLTSSKPFDFPQQRRKTKKDSDELIRSDERLNSGMQGIEPLWARVYGGNSYDYFSTLQPLLHSGCVAYCYDRGGDRRAFFKISDYGLIEWRNLPIGFGIECFESTRDGGYIGAGTYDSGASADILVIKFTSNLTVEWACGFGGMYVEEVNSIKQTSDGGYIAVCPTLSFLGAYPEQFDDWNGDILLVKLSENGDLEKQCSIGGPGEEYSLIRDSGRASVLETHDGYLVACSSNSFSNGGWKDIWLVKLNRDLNKIMWQKTYGGKESELLNANGPHIQLTPDGHGCIVVGFTLSFGVVNPKTNTRFADAWIFRINLANGEIVWQKSYGGEGADWANCIQPTKDGNYVVVGGTNSFSANDDVDIWFLIIDKDGKIKRELAYGSEFADLGLEVKQSEEAGFFIGGETYAGEEAEQNIIIIKTDANGDLYQGCGFVRDSHAVVSDTDVVPIDTYELPWPTNASFGKENMSIEQKYNIYLSTELICWNLNQPPVNVHFERQENKSFFASEAWHTITWSPIPYNSQFSIAEYRIYRKDMDDENSSYQLIGTVPANINIFVDTKGSTGMIENAKYLYVVTSVDSEGNESPRSEPVGNEN